MVKTHLDFESRSAANIQKVGAWRYAMHPSTEIIAIGIAIGDGPVKVIRRGDVPAFARNLTIRPDLKLCAHNVQFEYAMWEFIMRRRLGAPSLLDPRIWDCTMARALMCGYPAALGNLAAALRLPQQKDGSGKNALLKLCKPTSRNWLGEYIYNEDPALYEEMYAYNAQDVETERSADKALPELQAVDRVAFEKDLLINMRGMRADTAFARAAATLTAQLEEKLDADLKALTGGAVSGASRIGELKRYVASLGVTLPTKVSKDNGAVSETLDKAAVNNLLADPATPQAAKDALYIRAQAGKTSTAKYSAMLDYADPEDERLRGQYQYWGAGPGRWAGRGVQPQNLTKSASAAYPDGMTAQIQAEVIEDIKQLDAHAFHAKYGPRAVSALSGVIRGAIVPTPGKVGVQADLNAIEVRKLFWFAGEASGLAMYAQGKNPYIDMANYIYKRTDIVKGTVEYELGKRSVLGDGYGQGADTFIATTYADTAKIGRPILLPFELGERAVKAYREKYRTVVNLWYSAEAAAIAAVRTPGTIHATAGGKVHYSMSSCLRWLLCRLPSGRLLFYPKPVLFKNDRNKEALRYHVPMANGMMVPEDVWGGHLVENFTQASARDVLVHGMLEAEKDGLFNIVLHSHDELFCEAEDPGVASHAALVKELERRMSITPPWAPGLPLKAEGWAGYRYRK